MFIIGKKNIPDSFVSLPYLTSSQRGLRRYVPELTSLVFSCLTVIARQTSLVLQVFVFRMQEHQDVQMRAQKELDDVIGQGRLPTFADRKRLPYINALCKEILRYTPPVPGGMHLRVSNATLDETDGFRCSTHDHC